MSGLPDRKFIGNKNYKLTVWKVLKKFPNGTPREVERIPESGTTRVDGGEEFITAYIPEIILVPEQERK